MLDLPGAPTCNPYAPGASRPPVALVGRSVQVLRPGRDAQSMVLYGLRGVGKTVLLGLFARMARQGSWLVAQIEAKPGGSMREMVGEAFHDALVDLARPGVGERIRRALKTGLSFKGSYDSTGVWITSAPPPNMRPPAMTGEARRATRP